MSTVTFDCPHCGGQIPVTSEVRPLQLVGSAIVVEVDAMAVAEHLERAVRSAGGWRQ